MVLSTLGILTQSTLYASCGLWRGLLIILMLYELLRTSWYSYVPYDPDSCQISRIGYLFEKIHV